MEPRETDRPIIFAVWLNLLYSGCLTGIHHSNEQDAMQTVLLLASIQAFFLVALLLGKRDKHVSDVVLAIWLGVIGAHTLILFCFAKIQWSNMVVLGLNSSVPFLHGPFLYFYVDTVTSASARLKKSYALHLVPYLGFAIFQIFQQNPFTMSQHGQHVDIHLFDVSYLSNTILFVSVPAYSLWSLVLLKRYRRRILDTFSTTDRINLNWLRFLVTAMSLVWFAVLVFLVGPTLFGNSDSVGLGHLVMAPISLFVYATGYFGFRQTTIFSDMAVLPTEPEPIQPSEPEVVTKYKKSGLKENEATLTLSRLLKYMADKHPYLEADLTLPQVAMALSVSVNHLSQVINDLLEQNFFDFVNSFRVAAVKEKLQDSHNDAFSLLAIGLDCGFGSKSSFNRIFKSVTGETPSQYKKSLTDTDKSA